MKTLKRILKIIGIVCLAAIVVHILLTNICHTAVRHYIKTFKPVDYENQLIPVSSDGFVTFTTDKDFKVMQLNDIHICGGFASVSRDKLAIKQVMYMVSKEKPDLVILNGDSIFCVPAIVFPGGMTLNNRMTTKLITNMFEQLGVYYTVTFGNHDTEAFDFTNRKNLGKLYSKDKYPHCVFQSDYNGYGVTNQCILIKDSKGKLIKPLILLDSNGYVDTSISASINWKYDVIHEDQILWARDTIKKTGNKKALLFFHIPIGEFETAYRELKDNNFKNTKDSRYISGFWNELIDEELGGRIWYGGCCHTEVNPKDIDQVFEILGPEGEDVIEGIFCAHDHVNNAVVNYKGITLGYGNSVDNGAYVGLCDYGKQRGSMIITINQNSSWTMVKKNLYTDYGFDSTGVNLTDYYYPNAQPEL